MEGGVTKERCGVVDALSGPCLRDSGHEGRHHFQPLVDYGDETSELVGDLERSHRETEFWYETALSLVMRICRYPGVNYAEQILKGAETFVLRGGIGALDPASEAARLLVDHYRNRVARRQTELEGEKRQFTGTAETEAG